jgi:hypothetical protein
MIATTLLLAAALLCSPLGSSAQASKPSKAATRRDQKEHEALGERAEKYWRAVRWADPQSASIFIENSNDRVVFQQWLTDQSKDQKITEAKVLQVEVHAEVIKPKDGRMRTGQVTVSIDGFKLPEQVLKQQTLSQAWYRTPSGWFVDWAPPPPPKP